MAILIALFFDTVPLWRLCHGGSLGLSAFGWIPVFIAFLAESEGKNRPQQQSAWEFLFLTWDSIGLQYSATSSTWLNLMLRMGGLWNPLSDSRCFLIDDTAVYPRLCAINNQRHWVILSPPDLPPHKRSVDHSIVTEMNMRWGRMKKGILQNTSLGKLEKQRFF